MKPLPDYRKYVPVRSETVRYYCAACSAFFACGFLFYRSLVISLMCCLAAIPCQKIWIGFNVKKRRERLLEGFRDMLYCISAAVAAGRQLPQAVAGSCSQLKLSWGEDSDIYREAVHMTETYDSSHGDPDSLWSDFAERSGLAEIIQFASSCRICRKNGGNLEEVCFRCAGVLLEKIAFRDELEALSAQKRLDILILTAMPLGVLIFLNLFSFSYIEVLYTCFAGRLIMTVSLGCIGAALLWSLRIMEVGL